MISKEEFVARLRHLGWCCYQIAADQEYNTIPNKDQYNSLLQGTKFGLQNIGMTPEENHENWMRCKIKQGWVYGKIKDFEKKTHPDLVPFDELPKVEADKDIMDCMMVKELSDFYDEYVNNEENCTDEYEREATLVGFDIHKFVKKICEQFLSGSPDMTEGEKKAYKFGIDNTLRLLEQTLSEVIEDENAAFNNIAVHVPNLEVMTEFATIEDILNREV